MPFLDSLDIANRALQHCGGNQITAIDEDSKNNQEVSFAYDKLRRAELRRNNWRFSIKKVILRPIDNTTLLLSPAIYSAGVTYLPGHVVRDANGLYWVSLIPDNLGNTPGGNNEAWDAYFGPLTVMPWDAKTSYFSGELVYKAGAIAGSYQVFMSLKSANTDQPDVANPWASTTTYYADQVVSNAGSQWRSLLPLNLGITPTDGPANWNATVTYSAGNQVTGSNQKIYSSVGSGNLGYDPVSDNGVHWTDTNTYTAWSRTPTLSVSATSWRPLGTTALRALSVLYPIGVGPSHDTTTRNAYYLPAGFLRKAPRDPKAGSTSYLGAPSGLAYDDWTLEGKFLVSAQTDPITFRFVSDFSVVRDMDDMFCEGLAARLALEVADPLTQSETSFKSIAATYQKFMGDARLINAIEIGSEEPAEDDYIQCRA